MVFSFETYNLVFIDIYSYFEQQANNWDKLKDVYYQNRAYYMYSKILSPRDTFLVAIIILFKKNVDMISCFSKVPDDE